LEPSEFARYLSLEGAVNAIAPGGRRNCCFIIFVFGNPAAADLEIGCRTSE
jgi:hypothetical protein